MNNSRAKTILIVFFLLTNIILLSMLISSYMEYIQIPDKTLDTTVQLLSEKGITIDKSLIPDSIGNDKLITVNNVIDTYENFARNVLSENHTIEDGVFKNEKATINYYGDRFRITFNEGLDTSEKDRSPADKASSYLKSIGIDTGSAKISSSNNSEGLFTVQFSKAFYNKPFFDSIVTVEIMGTKIISVHGSWFEKEDAVQAVNLSSAPSLLVSFFSKNPSISDTTITNIQNGYAICENGIFHKQVTLIPVYEVTTDHFGKFYIDARGN